MTKNEAFYIARVATQAHAAGAVVCSSDPKCSADLPTAHASVPETKPTDENWVVITSPVGFAPEVTSDGTTAAVTLVPACPGEEKYVDAPYLVATSVTNATTTTAPSATCTKKP